MKKNTLIYSLITVFFASFNAIEGNANTIFKINPEAQCPDYTTKYKEGYCKAMVTNKFTGAYLDGSCPIGSAPVGEGYCMFKY
jgi:hypothetical protein